jgi:hypothetical protein
MSVSKQDLDKLEDSKQIAIDYVKLEKEVYQLQNVKGQVIVARSER